MRARALLENFKGIVSRRIFRTGIKYGNRWLTRQGHLNILIPSQLARIGNILAIEYDCWRDGEYIKARHVFTPGSRPVFAVGPDRGQLFLLGTLYQFTDRGILDFNTKGQAVEYNEKTGQIKPVDP